MRAISVMGANIAGFKKAADAMMAQASCKRQSSNPLGRRVLAQEPAFFHCPKSRKRAGALSRTYLGRAVHMQHRLGRWSLRKRDLARHNTDRSWLRREGRRQRLIDATGKGVMNMLKPMMRKVALGVPAVALTAALAFTMAGCGGGAEEQKKLRATTRQQRSLRKSRRLKNPRARR